MVGASDYILWSVWAKRFLEGQGYILRRNIFYQDNQSAMKIESNGQKSCGEKSRHIDIRYFFIKDIIKRENIELVHCPTERMIVDYYTKPLQGWLFRKMRDIIMGLTPFPDEERVGLNEKVRINLKDKVSIDPKSSEKSSSGVSRKPTTEKIQVKSTGKVRTYADIVRTVK